MFLRERKKIKTFNQSSKNAINLILFKGNIYKIEIRYSQINECYLQNLQILLKEQVFIHHTHINTLSAQKNKNKDPKV